ncbi:competence type IV pilus minor pilin ComGF [Sporosarcina sp. HYO08]|uniref:competence type IV pilus minor pilin ComGF n=1 Tax=Sporosarcina sp. HYO08 TaxID=1759557 RepID=UPI000799B4E5|nr:competence type IV pilus minor pilin ComGF [Sporosarcina sp. HYO08]KXH87450.1 hypothetical protein AU377_02440 [Sporosarcina sp. HYO08]
MPLWRRYIKPNRGYTFVESIFQLVILTVFLHLLVLFFMWKGTVESSFPDHVSIEWELFAIDMQQMLSTIDHLEIRSEGTALRFLGEQRRIDISRSNTVIRKQVDGQGHVPLLTNVRTIQFEKTGDHLIVLVNTLGGESLERSFAIGLSPK